MGYAPKDKDTSKWLTNVTIELIPVNKYGDELGESQLSYSLVLAGSLLDIVARLERLKESS